MRRPAVSFSIALALLLATGALVLAPRAVRDIPLVEPLELVPTAIEGWSGSNHVPTDVLPIDPHVGSHLFRTYTNGAETMWVSVGYYPAQIEGRRPTTEQLVYPGQGWADLSAHPVHIPIAGTSGIPATLVLTRTGERRVAILYWYVVRGRSVGSDHWYRALLLYNRLVEHRADGALVRIAAPIEGEMDPASAETKLARFVGVFYPELLRVLPR